jgi:hypothetical protein
LSLSASRLRLSSTTTTRAPVCWATVSTVLLHSDDGSDDSSDAAASVSTSRLET